MSQEAVRFVFERSPLAGREFLVHLAIADTVSAANEWLFWMSADRLARKARTTRRTVGKALAALVDAGCLEVVPHPDRRRSRYRFCFPDLPISYGTALSDGPERASYTADGAVDNPVETVDNSSKMWEVASQISVASQRDVGSGFPDVGSSFPNCGKSLPTELKKEHKRTSRAGESTEGTYPQPVDKSSKGKCPKCRGNVTYVLDDGDALVCRECEPKLSRGSVDRPGGGGARRPC